VPVERVERKLAAILAADVAGYSRLMGVDEAGTLAQLKAHRRELIDPKIAEHRGRVVKTTGDGILIEFPSVVEAVGCAVEVQQGMVERNADVSEDKRITFRVGVNLGDIIIDGDDIHGDGVNIAARLEAMAEPGMVCVSASAWEHARGKVSFGADDLGEHQLKNIDRPVRVFRIASSAPATATTKPLPLPDKPSIAVLPFTNLSGDQEQEYFSDGITEDIITELSRFRTLFVIARNSSFAFRGKSLKVQEIARELGVGYVVEGSVRRAADRVRITAQLVDGSTGNHLWAERYDRDMRDIFALQDEVARSVASTVSGRVEAAGRDLAMRLSPAALKSYDLVLRAKALTVKYTRTDNAQALACAERAVELDPTSARACAHAAWCHYINYMAGWTADREHALAKAYELAQRAVGLDETDSFARCILGLVHLFRREYEGARSEMERAVDLNPGDPEVHRRYGLFLAATGKAEAAIEQINLAKRLNPFDTRWVPWLIGIACFTARRYDDAIAALRQVRDPINEVRGWLAASYAHAGRLDEARATLDEFLRVAEADMAVFPGRRLKDWEAYWHGAFEYRDQEDFDHLFDALRKAGLSE
jgi:adenylate cyclase